MNLAEWMRVERPLSERLRAAETICAGLANATRGKGAFLDPTRIQVAPDGTCRLREGMGSFPEAGYRAPESIGRGNPTPRADVFVAGILAYQLLAGRHPFGGEDPSPEANPPQPLDALFPDIPPRLSREVMACLEPDPESRAPDVTSLLEVVREVRETGALESTQVGARSPAAGLDTSATVVRGGEAVDTARTLVGAGSPVGPEMVSTVVPGTAAAQQVAAAARPAPDTVPAALAVEAWPAAVTEGLGSPPPAAVPEPAPAPSPTRSAAAPAAPAAPASAPSVARPSPPVPAPARRSGGGMGVAVGLGALVVAGVAGFLWWRSTSGTTPGATLAASAVPASTLPPVSTLAPESILAATETTTVVRSGRPSPSVSVADAAATPPPASRPATTVPPATAATPPPPATEPPATTVPPRVEAPATSTLAPATTALDGPAPPASIANIAPPTVKRSSNALVDVHGTGFRPDHQVRVLRGGQPAAGVNVGRQRYMNAGLITVFLQVGSDAVPGAYQMIVVDGAGRESGIKTFQVAK
jgi:hypothetical protein